MLTFPLQYLVDQVLQDQLKKDNEACLLLKQIFNPDANADNAKVAALLTDNGPFAATAALLAQAVPGADFRNLVRKKKGKKKKKNHRKIIFFSSFFFFFLMFFFFIPP
jgi:hypothetical protein